MNKAPPHTTVQMHLTQLRLSKKSQTRKIYCMILFIYKVQNLGKLMCDAGSWASHELQGGGLSLSRGLGELLRLEMFSSFEWQLPECSHLVIVYQVVHL